MRTSWVLLATSIATQTGVAVVEVDRVMAARTSRVSGGTPILGRPASGHGLRLQRYYGREYCGRPLSHPFELYLTINQVTHRRTEIGSPETNGFCERFHRTVKEEFFAVAFRRTFYESVAQLQADLDSYLAFYNRERAHQGYRTQGRTPYQAFLDGIVRKEEPAVA